jgi:hypothetical protein
MPGKRTWIAALCAGLFAAAGCCGWCQKHCGCSAPPAAMPVNAPPAAGCCVPCPPNCCPSSPAGPIQPVPAAPQSWNRPVPAYSAPNACCPQ